MWDEAGLLLFELVPCINPSGTLGFYDTIGDIFYKNMNTNTNSANKFLADQPHPLSGGVANRL